MSQPLVLLWNAEQLSEDFTDQLAGEFEVHRTSFTHSSDRPDAIVLAGPDRDLPAIEKALAEIRGRHATTPLLLVASGLSSSDIMKLLQLGVSDFLLMPVVETELLTRLKRLIGFGCDQPELVMRLKSTLGLRQLVGESLAFQQVQQHIRLLAKCDSTVLIRGETGTGKELCTRAIHYLSSRSGKPFIPVNCGALPLELVENELFGHARSAFTGATSSEHGLIHDADGGTLFLDEIDSLPPKAQVKLLRFLQEREYRPLGSTKTQTADVRLIAATNSGVDEAIQSGRLRLDFYHRLNVLPLMLPSLRERSGDVLLLAGHFLARYSARLGRLPATFAPNVINALIQYQWPGNVRELEHVIERAVVLADGASVIGLEHIQLPIEETPTSFRKAKSRLIATFERSYVESLLQAHGGNISQAARTADKNRRAFWGLIRRHGIDVNRFRSIRPTAEMD